MNQLFEDLDGNEELVENNVNVVKVPQAVVYNKEEELTSKYAVAAPTVTESRPASNMFSKKRLIDEISKPVESVPPSLDDVEMEETPEVQVDDQIEEPAQVSVTKDISEKLAATKVDEKHPAM